MILPLRRSFRVNRMPVAKRRWTGGTTTAVLAGETVRLKFFCKRSKYSGKHFVRLYPCERQQAFLDAHIKALEFFGGVFPVLICDNLTTAVQKVLQGRGQIEQSGFCKFKAFYNFEARFCNPASGYEKGGVEGLVGFARSNYMVPVPETANLEELNDQVLRQCLDYGSHTMAGRSQSVETLNGEEPVHLLAPPEAVYSNIQLHDVRADKYATVMVDKNRYSEPWRHVGCKLKVILYVDRVEIFFGGKRLAVHERLYANSKWSLTPEHSGRCPLAAPDPSSSGASIGRSHCIDCWRVSAGGREKPRGSRTSSRC